MSALGIIDDEKVALAQRLIVKALDRPDDVAGTAYSKSLDELCSLLIQKGVTNATSDDVLTVKLLALKTQRPRLFLPARCPTGANVERLRAIEFIEGRFHQPTPPPAPKFYMW